MASDLTEDVEPAHEPAQLFGAAPDSPLPADVSGRLTAAAAALVDLGPGRGQLVRDAHAPVRAGCPALTGIRAVTPPHGASKP